MGANLVFARAGLRRFAMAIVLTLAACTASPELGRIGVGTANSVMQLSMGRVDRQWLAAPNALVMVQRANTAQLVGLENETTLSGDNFLWLYANGARAGTLGNKLRLEEVIARAGGVPAPFHTLDNSNLRSATDNSGQYFWQEYRAGAQTVCVLAIRQLKNGARALPRGTRELEVVLRNCVNGSVEQALSPIRDTQISRTTMSYGQDSAVVSRSLSPLAAPRQ